MLKEDKLSDSPSSKTKEPRSKTWCYRLCVWCNCRQYVCAGAHRRDLNDTFDNVQLLERGEGKTEFRRPVLHKLKF